MRVLASRVPYLREELVDNFLEHESATVDRSFREGDGQVQPRGIADSPS